MTDSNRTPNPDGRTPGEQPPPDPRWRRLVAATLVVTLLFGVVAMASLMRRGGSDPARDVEITEVSARIADRNVTEARLDDDHRTITVTLDDDTKLTASYPNDYGAKLLADLDAAGVTTKVEAAAAPSLALNVALSLLPLLLLGALGVVMINKLGGNRKMLGARSEPVEKPSVTFADIAGADEAIEDLRDIVDYLADPDRYRRYGARPPAGVLLSGPPGTGKSMLAKAVAAEAKCSFYAVSGSDFVEMYVGVGASRVRELFAKARKNSPAVIFVDEIEGVGKSRSKGATQGANEERENTLNALLVEMDGFRDSGVLVIAATNRPDMLDAALTRPGRFDRRVTVAAPDRKGRAKLFELYLGKARLVDGLDVAELARSCAARTMGMTGADIAAVVNEAAIIAARRAGSWTTAADIDAAIEHVALGRARISAVVSDRSRRITAWHEAGHALAALAGDRIADPERVSIVPRGSAGGVTWLGDDDEPYLSRSQARQRLVMMLGGRAAEMAILDGDFTQGASSDLHQATNLARQMVCEWGMTDTLARVDAERLFGEADVAVQSRIEALLAEAMDAATNLCLEYRPALDAIAEALLEAETIDAATTRAVAEAAGLPPAPPVDDAVTDAAAADIAPGAEGL